MPNEKFFKSFVMAGYECTYALTKHKRLDLITATRHDEYCRIDYNLIKELGIFTVREGLSWHQIDKGGGIYDFSRFEKLMQIAKEEGIQQVWDLNHFDFPEYLDPASPEFIKQYGEYAKQAVTLMRKYQEGTIFIVPWNEISYFSYIAGEAGEWAPFWVGRGLEFKKILVQAAISAMNAIREVEQDVRFLHVDPILYRAAKESVDEKAHGYSEQFREIPYQAWDMISGRLHPELGGDPKYLDIIGANYYYTNQEWVEEHEEQFIFRPIEWYSKDRIPLEVLLMDLKHRYNRPIVLTETASFGTDRTEWWDRVLNEIDRGLKVGIPIKGVCAYPIIDWPDWFNDQFTNSGLWDFMSDDPNLVRVPHEGTIELVKNYAKRWERR